MCNNEFNCPPLNEPLAPTPALRVLNSSHYRYHLVLSYLYVPAVDTGFGKYQNIPALVLRAIS